MPSLGKIEYDFGSHVRCLKFFLTDGTNSEKAGGFSLDKKFEFTDC